MSSDEPLVVDSLSDSDAQFDSSMDTDPSILTPTESEVNFDMSTDADQGQATAPPSDPDVPHNTPVPDVPASTSVPDIPQTSQDVEPNGSDSTSSAPVNMPPAAPYTASIATYLPTSRLRKTSALRRASEKMKMSQTDSERGSFRFAGLRWPARAAKKGGAVKPGVLQLSRRDANANASSSNSNRQLLPNTPEQRARVNMLRELNQIHNNDLFIRRMLCRKRFECRLKALPIWRHKTRADIDPSVKSPSFKIDYNIARKGDEMIRQYLHEFRTGEFLHKMADNTIPAALAEAFRDSNREPRTTRMAALTMEIIPNLNGKDGVTLVGFKGEKPTVLRHLDPEKTRELGWRRDPMPEASARPAGPYRFTTPGPYHPYNHAKAAAPRQSQYWRYQTGGPNMLYKVSIDGELLGVRLRSDLYADGNDLQRCYSSMYDFNC